MICPYCRGSGRSYSHGHHYICVDCDGTGVLFCSECGERTEHCACVDLEEPRPHCEKCFCPKCEAWDEGHLEEGGEP